MRAWDETEDALRRQAERRAEEHEETLQDLEQHGIDLDPATRTGAGGEPVEASPGASSVSVLAFTTRTSVDGSSQTRSATNRAR